MTDPARAALALMVGALLVFGCALALATLRGPSR
jgi:hypothetical protein